MVKTMESVRGRERNMVYVTHRNTQGPVLTPTAPLTAAPDSHSSWNRLESRTKRSAKAVEIAQSKKSDYVKGKIWNEHTIPSVVEISPL